MRKLIAGSFVTLDNVVQDPGGFGEIDRGGWALEYFDEGRRLFDTALPHGLTFAAATPSATGVVTLTYTP
ncbi:MULTISPECIES: hypothetical protein [unclassified Streptomyces]|uniref:hypothetical protein n=1 Tax=unclassified Streptomyces TaxID=2593676 RepID=UPI00344DE400